MSEALVPTELFIKEHPVAKYWLQLKPLILRGHQWMTEETVNRTLVNICIWCGNDITYTEHRLIRILRYLKNKERLPEIVSPSDPIFIEPYDIEI